MQNILFINISSLIYKIVTAEKLTIAPEFKHFCFSSLDEIPYFNKCRMITCNLNSVDTFTPLQGNLVYQNPERMIFEHNKREQRLYGSNRGVYGITYEISENQILIEFNRQIIQNLEVNLILLEMLALEKYLLLENAIVLHSSAIDWNGKAILFSAPSGTGKSTQADLWKKYESTEIINGDRNIIWLNPTTNSFHVCGIPFCGSSGINQKKQLPLHAVVFLSQAPQNKVQDMSLATAVEKLYSETSVNHWNGAFVTRSIDLIEQLAKNIKTLSLECTISHDAILELKKLL